MLISVTTLSSFLYCPRKLFLQHVLKAEEPPKKATIKGIIRHEAYDRINSIEKSIISRIIKKHTEEDIRRMYQNAYSNTLINTVMAHKKKLEKVDLLPINVFKEAWKLLKREAEMRSTEIIRFIQKNKVYEDELWEALVPKIQTEIRVSSKRLRLKGIIDRIDMYKDRIVPVELKTGKAPRDGVWPGHRIQI